jgi:hypothetical protein
LFLVPDSPPVRQEKDQRESRNSVSLHVKNNEFSGTRTQNQHDKNTLHGSSYPSEIQVGLIGICNLQLSCPSLGFMQGFKFAKKKNLHFPMSPSLHQCIAEMKRTFHSVPATSCTSM